MTIKRQTLRWAVTSILAIAAFAVLLWLDNRLKTETGYGTLDLQKAGTADAVNRILFTWRLQSQALLAGFNLGFDYLFMPLWGFAFYYGGLAARDAFAPRWLLRIATLIAAIPLAGALLDMAENGMEAWMLVHGASDPFAGWAFTVSSVKNMTFGVGLVLWVLGLLGALFRRGAKAD